MTAVGQRDGSEMAQLWFAMVFVGVWEELGSIWFGGRTGLKAWWSFELGSGGIWGRGVGLALAGEV